jgi:carbonic anhydrase
MSEADEVVRANQEFARRFTEWHLSKRPRRRLVVLACMDARLHVERVLGLADGDAHIIRNAGAIVTDDVLRSLVISHHELETRELVIIAHTECGLLGLKDDKTRDHLSQQFGPADPALRFYGFDDLDVSVREQIDKVRRHPWLAGRLSVRGFVYEVKTGLLREVV